jgi:hypothetical protein
MVPKIDGRALIALKATAVRAGATRFPMFFLHISCNNFSLYVCTVHQESINSIIVVRRNGFMSVE